MITAPDLGREMEAFYINTFGLSPLSELSIHDLLSRLYEFNLLSDEDAELKYEIWNETIKTAQNSTQLRYITNLFCGNLHLYFAELSFENVLEELLLIDKENIKYQKLADIIGKFVLGRNMGRYYGKSEIFTPIWTESPKSSNSIKDLIESFKKANWDLILESNHAGIKTQLHYTKNFDQNRSKLLLFDRERKLLNKHFTSLANDIRIALDENSDISDWILTWKILYYDEKKKIFLNFFDHLYIVIKQKFNP